MPALTMPGLSSGQNTDQIVEKLVKLEAKPMQRWEMQNQYREAQIQGWNELKRMTKELEDRTRVLVSFTADFAKKSVQSVPEGFLSGEASRSAQAGEKKISVQQLASQHQVSTKSVDESIQIPKGKFSILSGESRKDLNFAGGSIQDLADLISKSSEEIVHTSFVKVNDSEYVLSLRSVQAGEAGKLKFLDPNGVLKAAQMVGDSPQEEPSKITLAKLDLAKKEPFQNYRYTETGKETNFILPGQNGFVLSGHTAYQIPVEPKEIEKRLCVSFVSEMVEQQPDLQIGVLLEGEKSAPVVRVAQKGDKDYTLRLSEFLKKGKIQAIILANSAEDPIKITGSQWVVEPEIKGAPPVKEIQKAQDAVFSVDGVEVQRDKNEGITDVLEGVSLNLLKKTEEPVSMEIHTDAAVGIELLQKWVEAYNSVLDISKQLTDSKESKPPQLESTGNDRDISSSYWQKKTETGLLSGDNTILRLVSGLKSIVSAAYPGGSEDSYRMLSEIGISTGKVGSKWTDIQKGFLQIDTIVLEQKLSEDPDAVRALFASDTNFDSRMDNGVGVKILDHLKPYNQFAGGFISGKIKMLQEQIASNKDEIKDYQRHLDQYEQKLRDKFMYMEMSVGKSKSVGSYLQNNLSQ